MMASDELIGAIAAERRDGETFQYAPEDIIAFSACAAGMSWGIQSLFLRDRTDRLSARDEDSIEEIVARERREIGRELHDNVVQNLAYLNMKMEIIARYVNDNPEIAKNEIQAVRDLVDKTVVELRRTIGEMRRPAPARRGITGQLRSIAKNIQIDASEFEMDLKQISGVQLIPEVERAVVGIVREALQDVRKHAEASSVRLEVTQREGDLILHVIDDGKGMDNPGMASPIDHFGLTQMRELAEDLGGELSVVSDAGQGTRIEARLPLVVPAGSAQRQLGGSGLSASEYLSQPPPEPPDLNAPDPRFGSGE
jgi:signal transduction histidine kinase